MTAALTVSGLHKAFGEREVLRGVSFEVAHGETLGLVGVNGAGKTTLLRNVLDLTRPDGGTITLDGRPHREPAARRGLAYLAERFVPPPFATGAEVLRYLLALHDLPWEPAAAADEARALDLDPAALGQPVREYSKGMTQKLGLAACLLARRSLTVLDEPMSGLDPRARAAVKTRLREGRNATAAVLLTTHLLEDVEALCDRVVVLHGGRVAWQGTPRALRETSGAATLEQAFLDVIDTAGAA